MDFNQWFVDFLASLIMVFRRLVLLIFFPYKTLRKISQENDNSQVLIILLFVFLYFQFGGKIRPFYYSPWVMFLIFLVNFFLGIGFFCLVFRVKEISQVRSFLFTLSYCLLPTLMWFVSSSIFYYLLPPPRTMSLWGKGFSIFYIAFSVSVLAWKLILTYLAIRFSAKKNFYQVIYYLILYLAIILPYSVLLYQLRIFRVPFI
jgi:hypothetical protein